MSQMDSEPVREEEQQPVYETAFTCYLENGHWVATPEIRLLQLRRSATPDDFYHAASTVKRDIETWEVATKTVQLHQQTMRQTIEAAAQRQSNERLQEATGVGGAVDLSQLRRSG